MDKAATMTTATDYVTLSGGLNAAAGTNPLNINGDSQVMFTASPVTTFTGVSLKFYLLTPNGTWVPVAVIDDQSKTAISAGAVSVSDSTTKSWSVRFPTGMYVDAKVVLNAIGGGSVVGEITSGKQGAGGTAIVVPYATTAQTFSAGITLNGATGVNVISIPDNLADALSISEGTNAYITFTTTDAGELINVKKTLKFGGTTGNNIIAMVDNLADALSVKEGSNFYLTFVTTDSGELINATANVKLINATTPILTLESGGTNTGHIDVKGKTSGMLKITAADATAQTVTVTTAAQTSGASTWTIPDAAGAAQTFVTLALTQTLTNKTLTTPVINGATSASGNFDLSGSTGTFLTSTGVNTLSGTTTASKGLAVSTGGATAITTTRAVTKADSGGIFTVSQAAAYTVTVATPAGAGERYLFQCVAPGANDVSIVATGCTFEGVIVNDVTSVIAATGSTLKFATGAAALGDCIELVSTSTSKFFVRAITSAAGGITVA